MMRSEKSSGAIIFVLEKEKPVYLLLYGPSYWGFVKGLIEKDEDEEKTAQREAQEEAGLKIKIIEGFKETIKYMYKFEGELISKQAVFFVAQAQNKEVRISNEHEDFKWVSIKDAMELMRHKNQKDMLRRADTFLMNWIKQKRLEN